jgi:hypothetical protein
MDRTTKILLAAIALGLWANAGVSALRPATAQVSRKAHLARKRPQPAICAPRRRFERY